MHNIRRRLQVLERLSPFQPAPSPLEQIERLALRSLAQEDLDLLHAIKMRQAVDKQPAEFSGRDAAAYASYHDALEVEARQMGFRSFAIAGRRMRQGR